MSIKLTINNKFLIIVLVIFTILSGLFMACSPPGSSSSGVGNNAPLNKDVLFWLEPSHSTIIGIGQSINIFIANKKDVTDNYPVYLDPTLISFSSSLPSVASISANGIVQGLSEGTTVVTATYLGYSSELIVQVSGSMISRTILVPGQGMRSYSIYVPHFLDDNNHAVVLSFHGGGGNANLQAASSQLNKLASEKKFYVVYPNGTGVIKTFNGGSCCGSAQADNINDILFVNKILDDIESKDLIDPKKIYSTGFSNGAIFSYRLACELSDRISAIAPVSGASGEFDFNSVQYYNCTPARPIPILHIHATNDRNYPIEGGVGEGLSATPFYSVQSTVSDWLIKNNLTGEMTVEIINSTTKCHHYKTVANVSLPSAPVTLCVLNPIDVYDATNEIVFGGGHSWPGGVKAPTTSSDVPLRDFDASSYIWNFFNN